LQEGPLRIKVTSETRWSAGESAAQLEFHAVFCYHKGLAARCPKMLVRAFAVITKRDGPPISDDIRISARRALL
jgi:hypothetical protein